MDQAFAVSRFFARGGSVMNYYMYHGGNNYGRTAGGGVQTQYAPFANLQSNSLPNEPKYSHLTRLHNTIAKLSSVLVNTPAQVDRGIVVPYQNPNTGQWSNGTDQKAFCYQKVCFVESNADIPLNVSWAGQVVYMPPRSLMIYNGATIVFNTSDVLPPPTTARYDQLSVSFNWTSYSDPIYTYTAPMQQVQVQERRANANGPPVWHSTQPLEQLQLTLDTTDHMWYTASFSLSAENAAQANSVVVTGCSANAYLVWIDNVFIGADNDHRHCWPNTNEVTYTFQLPTTILPLQASSTHSISILSSVLGIDNGMGVDSIPYTEHFKGIIGQVTVGGAVVSGWTMRSNVVGEWLGIFTAEGRINVPWSPLPAEALVAPGPPLQWYHSTFDAVKLPPGSQLLLNATGLQRGHVWINGNDIGTVFLTADKNGQPSQGLYHIPPDWITQDGVTSNDMTIFEEEGVTNLSAISLVTVSMTSELKLMPNHEKSATKSPSHMPRLRKKKHKLDFIAQK